MMNQASPMMNRALPMMNRASPMMNRAFHVDINDRIVAQGFLCAHGFPESFPAMWHAEIVGNLWRSLSYEEKCAFTVDDLPKKIFPELLGFATYFKEVYPLMIPKACSGQGVVSLGQRVQAKWSPSFRRPLMGQRPLDDAFRQVLEQLWSQLPEDEKQKWQPGYDDWIIEQNRCKYLLFMCQTIRDVHDLIFTYLIKISQRQPPNLFIIKV